MRDPCIIRAPDGKFHMVWTDSWTDRSIGYANSDDLIHWTPQLAIPVMEHEPTARNCWAPEIVFDSAEQHFLTFWSTTIPGRFADTDNFTPDHYNHRIYSTSTKDFKTFTPTKLFYDGGFNVIDATLLADNGKWRLFVKDESQLPAVKKCLHVAHAEALEGPYTDLSPAFTEAWVEGPSALRIGEWVYEGTATIDYGGPDDAHWAPDVIFHDGHYHMFLSVVPGMHTDWNADRRMVHLTSSDLLHWSNAEEI